METHGRESLPQECCGVLLAEAADPSTVTRALRAENDERGCPGTAYSLGHRAHIEAVQMEAGGEAHVVGYYHSHPRGAATPSRRDLEQAIEDVTYLILGMANGLMEHGAWRLEGDGFTPEPFEVIDNCARPAAAGSLFPRTEDPSTPVGTNDSMRGNGH